MLFIAFEWSRYDFQTKTSKYIDSWIKIERDLCIYPSISKTSGENKMFKLTSAFTQSNGRNINMSDFISYVFTEDWTKRNWSKTANIEQKQPRLFGDNVLG